MAKQPEDQQTQELPINRVGRPRKYPDDAARQKAFRERRKAELEALRAAVKEKRK